VYGKKFAIPFGIAMTILQTNLAKCLERVRISPGPPFTTYGEEKWNPKKF